MAATVSVLGENESELKGEMVSPYDPPRFWKVIDGTDICCVCTTEEHASAIAGALGNWKAQKNLGRIRSRLDKSLSNVLVRQGQHIARCAHENILRIALNEWDQLALGSAGLKK